MPRLSGELRGQISCADGAYQQYEIAEKDYTEGERREKSEILAASFEDFDAEDRGD